MRRDSSILDQDYGWKLLFRLWARKVFPDWDGDIR